MADDKVYTVKLADGTEIAGLKLNGNNFVSLVEVEANTFEGNTYPVIIEDNEGNSEEHPFMELVQVTQMDEEWWFILRDVPTEELKDIKVRSDIDYIAFMSNIDLEEA